MVSFTHNLRITVLSAILLLSACNSEQVPPARAEILSARISQSVPPILQADTRMVFSVLMQEALQRGIPLRLEIRLRGWATGVPSQQQTMYLQLRYLPLARRYQLTYLESGDVRSFSSLVQMLAALDQLRIPLSQQWLQLGESANYSLRIRLDNTSLPGPLRLPALFSSEWQFASYEYPWTAAA